MFERFTDRSRRVVVLAEKDAKELAHSGIRPEHLLLALSEEREGVAGKALARAGIDPQSLRERVAATEAPKPDASAAGRLPFSRQAKKVLELALREALQLGHSYIGTEHLLLGVIRWSSESGTTLEELLGVPTHALRSDVVQLVSGTGRHAHSPAVVAAMERAQKAAGKGQVTSGQLLVALVEDEASQAATVLSSLGVTRDAVSAALQRTPAEGTSDAAPQPQPLEVKVGDSTVTVTETWLIEKLRAARSEDLVDALRRHFADREAGETSPNARAG